PQRRYHCDRCREGNPRRRAVGGGTGGSPQGVEASPARLPVRCSLALCADGGFSGKGGRDPSRRCRGDSLLRGHLIWTKRQRREASYSGRVPAVCFLGEENREDCGRGLSA